MSDMIGEYVVVTTNKDHRGVFGGVLESYDKDKGTAEVSNARMCVYWSRETHGVLGLAAKGPASGSRISDAIPKIALVGVSSVMLATDVAKSSWESGVWE